MFYDKFVSLCAQKGDTPTQVAKNIGLSNAAATGWKNGKNPNDITLRRLADYFSVSVEELNDEPVTFYRNYIRLCSRKGKSPSAVALEIGLTKSSVTRWKAGGIPSDVTLTKIADYFGISVSELVADAGDGEEKNHPVTSDDRMNPDYLKLNAANRAAIDAAIAAFLASQQSED